MTALVAALAAGLAAACLHRRRVVGAPPAVGRRRWAGRETDLARHPRELAAAAALAALPAGPVLALALGIVVMAVVPTVADGVAAREAGRLRSGWQSALVAFAAALRASAPTADALYRGADAAGPVTADPAQGLGRVAAAVRLGADPAAALAHRFPHGPGAALGATLGLAQDLGAPPAVLATRLAEQAAAATRSQQATAIELSGARATVNLLAALPLAGLGLAAAFGASAPAYLLSSATGHACLLAAACFEAAGLTWSRRLLRAVS